ncbi:MAG TPA: hypothetical protein VK762_08275 [Polyangiaceae bacterium]|nr:hypothetical protein [Polyangiaceae bacterium]
MMPQKGAAHEIPIPTQHFASPTTGSRVFAATPKKIPDATNAAAATPYWTIARSPAVEAAVR